MKMPAMQRRTFAIVAVIAPLLILLVYVALRSGPLAPIAVTETTVSSQALRPALFGIGSIEARHTFKIGPTFAGRLKRLDVQVGDSVKAGQPLGEMDPVDLDDRVRSQDAALKRAEAALREASARQTYAASQANRYQQLFASRAITEEMLLAKRQEQVIADAALAAVSEDLARVRSDLNALRAQRANLRLVAPADGVVTSRDTDPGTTVVAGQTVVELIDPKSLWVNARFDQISVAGLSRDLPARIALRSRGGETIPGRVLRVEPKADAITEETLVKVVFDQLPAPLPPIGEIAEVTVDLPPLASTLVIPNAAIQRQGNQTGVWRIAEGEPRFVDVRLGRADLEGRVQVLEGLNENDRIVVYREKALAPKSRIHLVDRIPGAKQ